MNLAPTEQGTVINSGASPIRKVDDHLLLHILTFNANMEDDPPKKDTDIIYYPEIRALTNIRDASHVCHLWRQTILSSTVLWGRLMDLDLLILLKEEWRQEVIRRTGEAPLHVRGYQSSEGDTAFAAFVHFLVYILEVHWSRIETLIVSIYPLSTYLPDAEVWYPMKDFWSLLSRPSDTLKTFRFGCAYDEHSPPGPLALFSAHIPQLMDFRLTEYFRAGGYISAPWLSQLRHLDISAGYRADPPLTLSMWLEKLRDMPHLQSLTENSIFATPEESIPPRLPVIQLPNLIDLRVTHGLYPATLLLNHIEPHPECRLIMYTPELNAPTPSTSQRSLINHILAKYAERLLCGANRTNMILHFYPDEYFRLAQLERDIIELSTPGDVPEVFVFEWRAHMMSPGVPGPNAYIAAFSQCDYSHIMVLSVEIGFLDKTHQELHHQIQSFLHSMPNVQFLGAKMSVIEQFMILPPEAGVPPVFPKLQKLFILDVVYLTGSSVAPDHGPGYLEVCLRQREADGCPVQVLDLTACDSLPDMSYLEAMKGMSVIWIDSWGNRKEAICGLGVLAEEQWQ
ncbi:unnamed protein product [Cyclocybe aegerita]|uniref:F-box domain-containing protein n=1 Tax=Cyclocybe aegerita TaxID=1973307 RepID=A0A8S0VSV3_CYCAE|nr:unnamed protein product [Cyclocybe aegerita]